MRDDLYRLLGVSRDADQAALRRAYQRLARRYHPDLHPGDTGAQRRFREVARAYQILSHPEARRRYDLTGEPERALEVLERDKEAPLTPTVRRVTSHRRSWSAEIEALLVAETGGELPFPKSRDVTAEVSLGFREAIRGSTTSLSVQRERRCEECGGQPGSDDEESCPRCGGRGTVVELERIRVRIPPGVGEGSRLRVPGKGHRREAGGRPGDLYLTIKVRPHSHFQRRGPHIFTEVPVTLAEAILGAQIEIPTIDGPVRVKVPPGTGSGQRFRLRRRGVALPDGWRGDHIYTIRVVLPENLSEKARKLLLEITQENPRKNLPKKAL